MLRCTVPSRKSRSRPSTTFFPAAESRRILKQARKILKLAGRVRDFDIALELAAESGIPANAELSRKLTALRQQTATRLLGQVRKMELAESERRG